MKHITALFSFVLVASVCGSAIAQGFEPTKEHKLLMKEVGTWNAKGKLWMPGAEEPTEFEGVEVNRSVGGMWIVSDFKGNFFGQKFEGHAMTGYDMDGKKYMGIWFDSMSPYPSKMEGSYDAEKSTMTFNTVTKNPENGEEMKGKNVVHYKDKNTRVMTMYSEMDGKMTKSMEMVYTRKKGTGSGAK